MALLSLRALCAGVALSLLASASWGAHGGLRRPRDPLAPAQQLQPSAPRQRATLETDHFQVTYDASVLSEPAARHATGVAEQGWRHCAEVFGKRPTGKIRLNLTPQFAGATGFALTPDPESRDPDERTARVGVRIADLEYLGLSEEYVLTHEIGHIFSGDLAGTALGEGIADWAAGRFSSVPAAPWWGSALEAAGLWIDPDSFFITGEFAPRMEVDAVIRTAQYVESGLLVRFLAERFGWDKTAAFAAEYGKARGRLNSNAERKRLRVPRTFRPGADRRDPRLPPDPEAVRAVFERQFGESWDKLQTEWRRWMESAETPAAQAEQLVLGQRLYGAIRNWEMWLIDQKPGPSREMRAAVREAFTQANRALSAGSLEKARQAFQEARSLVEQIRHPKSIARARSPEMGATGRRECESYCQPELWATWTTVG